MIFTNMGVERGVFTNMGARQEDFLHIMGIERSVFYKKSKIEEGYVFTIYRRWVCVYNI